MANNMSIEDLQRSTVIDQDGDKVGKVGQVYLDDANGQPNWVTVNTGLFGGSETFIPLDEATQDGDDLRVPYTKAFIKDAPNLDADSHVDESQEDELYRYYGLQGGGDRVRDGRDGHVDGRDAAVAGAAGTANTRDRRDDLRDGDARHRDDVAAAGAARGDDANSVVRHEEEVNVGTERVQTGRARLRKHIVHDTKTVTVPVEREEVEIVREPIADGEHGGELSDGDVEVTLSEERPVVEKDVVAKERVGLDKNVVRDQEQVQTDVAREEVEIERDGDVRNDRI
ncbi:MAG: photosystem reaction center protein H [Kocuria palustris]|nr:MAG: photosystem reaction center protein H [Kocuria palustris]